MNEQSSNRPQYKTVFPSENGARAALMMEHVWPELEEYVTIRVLAERYYFDSVTLEVAARELCELGLLERTETKVMSKFLFLFPFEVRVNLYRRKK